jgi:hypothetical protein
MFIAQQMAISTRMATGRIGPQAEVMGTATTYDPGLSLREARARYFIDNEFGGPEGNYGDRWVKVSLGPVPIVFPNSAARVRAVRYHDLHHVLTGYATTTKGETEIAAWELASGCRSMVAAWVLNLLGMALGLVIDRHALFAAFVRGRHSRNLYASEDLEGLLACPLGEQRARLGLDREPPEATAGDRAAFVGYAMAAVMVQLSLVALLLVPLAGLAWLVAGALG